MCHCHQRQFHQSANIACRFCSQICSARCQSSCKAINSTKSVGLQNYPTFSHQSFARCLQEAKKKLSTITSMHVYSVQPSQPKVGLGVLDLEHFTNPEPMPQYCKPPDGWLAGSQGGAIRLALPAVYVYKKILCISRSPQKPALLCTIHTSAKQIFRAMTLLKLTCNHGM